MSARCFASVVDVTRNGSEGSAKTASSDSSAPAKASPACTRPSAIAVSMPADLMPAVASKLGLIWSFPALNSATCFVNVVKPSPGIAVSGYSVGISQTVWARGVAGYSNSSAPASKLRSRNSSSDPHYTGSIIGPAWQSCLARCADHQTQKAHPASECGKAGAECQRKRRAIVTGEGEAQRRERGTGRLPGQSRGCDDAAGAAAPMRWRARHQGFHVGRLKEAESYPADHHAPADAGDAGRSGD